MTDRFMTKTPLEGGFYPVREFLEDGKKWYVVSNAKEEYNFADSTGRILCEKEFKDYKVHAGILFHNGYATIVQENRYLNFVSENGDLVIKDDSIKVKSAGCFSKGFALVYLQNEKRNVLTSDGRLMLPVEHSYELETNYINNFAIVSKKGKLNYVDLEGKLLLDKWVEDAQVFNEVGLAICCVKNKGYNVIDTKGKIILTKYYSHITLCKGIIIVRDNSYVYLFNKEGKEICVGIEGYYTLEMDLEKEYVLFRSYYLPGSDNLVEKSNVFLSSGKQVFDNWYDRIDPIRITSSDHDRELFFVVYKRNSMGRIVSTIMDKNGKYAFTRKWFQCIDAEYKRPKEYVDRVTVKYNGKWYNLNFNENNNLTPIKWRYSCGKAYPYVSKE